MNHEQLLNDFVDGTLDYQGEATLFAELHLNEHLRGDLKTLLLMQRGVRHDMAAYFPPTASTNEIFRRLGFASEGGSGPLIAGAASSRFARLLHGLTGGIVGALLMLAFVIWQPGLFSIGSTGPIAPAVEVTAGSRVSPAPASATAGTRNSALDTIASSVTPPRMNGAASRKLEGRGVSRDADATAQRFHNSSTKQEFTAAPSISEPETKSQPTNAGEISPVELIAPEPARAMPDEPIPSSTTHRAIDGNSLPDPWESSSLIDRLPLSIEVRALESRSFERVPGALDYVPSTLLRNMAIGIRYDIDGRHGAGVEFGQEMFYQKFLEEEANGDLVQHEQNPLLPWVGATYRYNLYNSSGLNPFVQLLLGATQVGPIGRAMLGAHYEILPELHLSGGVESSGIRYSLEGRSYYSWKYGVTYGMSVNF